MDSDRSEGGHRQHSNSELLSSAKVVAQAAQSVFGNEADKVDKAKAADAAGDLLGAAREYGKLDDKGVGQYVDKAEDYLHQYGGGAAAGGHTADVSKSESHGEDHSSAKPEGHSESGGGGGFGDYMKVAQGFLKK